MEAEPILAGLRKFKAVFPLLAAIFMLWATGAFAAGGDLVRQSGDSQAGKQETKAAVTDRTGCVVATGFRNLAGDTNDDWWTAKFNTDGTVAWRASYNRSGGTDQATAVATDSANDVIVAGFAWNGVNFDIHTIKYRGSDGAVLWQHTYNSPTAGNDVATAVALDGLDNVYVGGHAQNVYGNEDYILIKYGVSGPNPDGTPLWTATWNGSANGTDKLVAMDAAAGTVALTGQSWNGTDFDTLTVAYDYAGTKLWDRRYSTAGANADAGKVVKIDGGGNVIVASSVSNGANLDIHVAKYAAADGAPVWQRTKNGGFDEEPAALALDGGGNVYLAGYLFTLSGHEDVYTARFGAADGNPDWERTHDTGGESDDIGTGIILDGGGNVFVSGYTVTAAGTSDFLVLKYMGQDGSALWNASFGGAAGKNDKPAGIGFDATGRVVVTGWSDMWTSGSSDYDYYQAVFDQGAVNPPGGLAAEVLSDTSVRLTWTDNSANEDGFRIEHRLGSNGEWSEAGTVGAGVTTFTDTGLVANSTYYYRVKATSAADGDSNPSPELHVLTLYVSYMAPAWSYTFNGSDNSDDFPSGIATGPDNHPVVTGYSMSTVGGFDYYTLKLDRANGSFRWADRYNDPDDELDVGRSVVVDRTNAAIVTGYSSLYHPPAEQNINSIYTLKYPANGSPLIWHGQYNGPGGIDDRAVAVASAVNGTNAVVVAGYGKNTANNDDIYLVKYAETPAMDMYGKAIPAWSATPYNGGGDDRPSAVAFDLFGNVLVTGYRHNGSNFDIFTAKYDGATGAKLWDAILNGAGNGNDYGQSLAVDAVGDVYVTGSAVNGAGNADIITVKYVGSTGAKLWERTVDGAAAGGDEGRTVRYDQVDGSVVVGGTVLVSAGDHDYLIIRYGADGAERWRRIHQRPGTDEAAAGMAMDVSGNVCIVGHTGNGVTTDALSVKYDHEGTLIAATIYSGAAGGFDEATSVAVNSLGETLVAGYTTNVSGNADYLVYKGGGMALQASAPFTVTPFYTRADLVWANTSTVEDGFYVERKVGACDSETPWLAIHTGLADINTYSDAGLTVGAEYCYRVRAFKAGEPDPRWVERHVVMAAPTPPGSLTATAVNTTRVDLAWQDNTTGETGFRIFRCSGLDCADFAEIGSVAEDVTAYTDSSAAHGTSYSYKVLAHKTGDWQSQFSSVAVAATPSPSAPGSLSATRISEGEVRLTWTDTTSDETGFRIERCAGSGCSDFAQIDSVGAGVVSYNDVVAMVPDTLYRYRVRAYKSATQSWDSPYSAAAEVTTTATPPASLTATAANTTTVNLAWTDTTGSETGFSVSRCQGGGCSDFGEAALTSPNAVSWADTGVCPGTSYTYRVQAVNRGLSFDGGGGWTRRAPLTISSFQPNFQVKVTVPYDADMQADFDDIRFYDETAKRQLPHWIERKTDGVSATVWVKAGTFNTVSLYYGNPQATTGDNGAGVFELFDDFANLSAWTTSGSAVTAAGGIATVDSGGTVSLYRNFSVSVPFIAEARYQHPSAYRNRLFVTTAAGTGSPTGYDYGIFNSNGQIYWNGWQGTTLTVNTWYILKWEITDANYVWRLVNDTTGAVINSWSHGSAVAGLQRLHFSGNESASSDFKLDWVRIRKSAATEPSVSIGSEEAFGGAFAITWTGSVSNTASATTPTPTAPSGLTASRVSESRIDLSWTDTTNDESGFRVERCAGNACSDFSQIADLGPNTTSFSDTAGLAVDTVYRYRVRAYKVASCNGGWSGPWSGESQATTTLTAPSGTTATASVAAGCEELRFVDSDGTTILNHWVESGCGTDTTKIWLKVPTLPVGSRTVHLYTGNPVAPAAANPQAVFDLFEDFSGTTIDTGRWVKTDPGNYLSQNGELSVSGGTGSWGGTALHSSASFARPFVFEARHKQTANWSLMFGVKDNTANTSYTYYPHAIYPYAGNNLQVYESGSNRGSYMATITPGTWYSYRIEALTTGAKYYVGTSPSTLSLFYTGTTGTSSPLKVGFDNANQVFVLDDIRVRRYASPEPTFSVGASEFGVYALTGGTWQARRPITLTNGAGALTNHQVSVTVNTLSSAADRIAVQWTDTTASETGFTVERCSGTGCDFSVAETFTVAANATSYLDRAVAVSTTYCYRVKALREGVWTSAPSPAACATTATPAAPVLSAISSTKIDLSWVDGTTGEDGFQVERCSGSGCDFTAIDSGFPVFVGPNVAAYADAAVCSGTYRYRVKSVKAGVAGWPGYSNIAEGEPLTAVPPSGLAASRISDSRLDLSWTDTTTDETGFKIERCAGSGCSDFAQIATVGADAVAYADGTCNPGVTYRYRVRAYKDAACGWDSGYSNVAEATATILAPSSLTVTPASSTQLNLAWVDTSSVETGFSIERCSGASCSDFSEVAQVGPGSASWNDTSVCQGISYSYRIRAFNRGLSADNSGCWSRRAPLAISNFQPDFQVKVTIPYDADMQADFDDIRFFDETGRTELPYWIEKKTDGVSADVWLKTGANNTVTLYYGNPSAAGGVNGTAVFEFFDDFNGSAVDTTKWTVTNGTGFSVSGGALRGTDTSGRLTSKATFSAGVIQEVKARTTKLATDGQMVGGFFGAAANAIGWLEHAANLHYRNDGAWTSKGGSPTPAANMLYAITVKSATTVNLLATNLDTPAAYWNVGDLANAVSAEPIALGRRYDSDAYVNQSYATDWDWVRVRKYAATVPTATVGSEEQSGTCFSFQRTFEGPYSATATSTPPSLAAPGGMAASRGSEVQVNLSWTDTNSYETAYVIERCTGASCDFTTKDIITVTAGTTSYGDLGLMPDTTYRYRVQATRAASCTAAGPYGSTVQAVTTTTAPTGFTATAVDTTTVRLGWTDTAGGDSGYRVERCTGAGCSDFSTVGTSARNAVSYTDTTVCPGSSYVYRVRAVNSGLSQDGGGCWTRRVPVTIADFQAGVQTKITIPYDSDMRADFSDLRFFDPAANQELPHWVAAKTDGVLATVWIRPFSSATIHLYYGNASAPSSADGYWTFDLFDDFSEGTLNAGRWTKVGTFYGVQDGELVSSGGSANWDTGVYSTANFARPFVLEMDHKRIAGQYMMLGAKDRFTGINYTDFVHAVYPIYDGGGNRLQVYEDGTGRGDRKSGIPSGSWQYLRIDALATGATYYHGTVPGTYGQIYTGTYSSETPLKVGFTNLDQVFRLDNIRVRKYASPEPSATIGAEEQSACFGFTGLYTGPASTTASVSTPLPVAPSGLSALPVSDTRIDLSWSDGSTDEGGFRIEMCTGTDCTDYSETAVVAANVTTHAVNGLAASTDYCFRVRGYKAATCSGGWQTGYAGPVCARSIPNPPGSLTAAPVNAFKVELQWVDLASDEEGYEIEVKAWNGEWVKTSVVGPGVTSFVDTIGIDPMKTYTYRVRAYRGADRSPYSNEATATTPAYNPGDSTCP